jgi:polar amino acid transport system substrate-binding protein
MRIKIILVLVALALVAAGCGDDDATTTTAAAAGETTTTPAAETTTTAAAETTTTAAAETTTTAAASACAVESLELITPGTLTVATGEPAFPPWVGTGDDATFDAPQSGTGFESAVVYEIATRLGFTEDQVVWVRTGFDEAIAPGPKSFDFNIQQYSINDERDEVVDFSVPYYVTTQALVTFEDSPFANAQSLADLADAKLGAQIGTTSLDFIEEVIQPNQEAAVYDTNVDAKSAMDAGQLDGIVVDLPTGFYITAVEIEGSVIAAAFAAQAQDPDVYGLLFAEGNTLKGCIDPVLEAMRADGTLAEFEDQWLTSGSGIFVITG